MYIGHFAPSLAVAGASPEAPRLGTLFIAGQLVDLAFFPLLIAGVEHARIVPGITRMNPMDLYFMPYTHSLLGAALWAVGMGIVLWAMLRSPVAAVWTVLVVVSHWFLDLLVHRPDLTLAGSPPKLGLGMWNYPFAEIGLELGLVGVAFWYFLRRTRGPAGPPLILLAVMLLFQAINWFGPQPTKYSIALPLTALFSYAVMIALARWVGTTRRHHHAAGLAMGASRR